MFDRLFKGPVQGYFRSVRRSIMIKVLVLLAHLFFLEPVSAQGYFDDLDQRATTSCDCGWRNRARIVGGKETGENEYPFMAVLLDPRRKLQFCGGSIVTQRHILTAAHCIPGKKPEDILVAVGAHDLEDVFEFTRRQIHVERILTHEQYESGGYQANDISLLLTKEIIPFSRNIGPVCLLKSKIHLQNHMVKVLGWGLTKDEGKTSPVLREVDLRVIPYKQCNASWSEELLKDTSSQICTYTKGKDSCNADSGGPLIWQDPEIGRYAQVALVSYGEVCGGSKPAVNTDVTFHHDWIQSTIQASFPAVQPCEKVNI